MRNQPDCFQRPFKACRPQPHTGFLIVFNTVQGFVANHEHSRANQITFLNIAGSLPEASSWLILLLTIRDLEWPPIGEMLRSAAVLGRSNVKRKGRIRVISVLCAQPRG